MSIQEIYKKYNIMPNLQLHQLRVASVSKIICDSISDFKNTDEVIVSCLLHDMGNIIKFDLSYFPEFTKPEGLNYWQGVKDEYIKKYGNSEHLATEMIIKEITDSDVILENVRQVGFSKLDIIAKDESLIKKICTYSDMRVGPHGVITTEERLIDGKKRYEGRVDKAIASSKYNILAESLKEIEKQIFSISEIKPENINDELVNGVMEGLSKARI